MNNKQLTGALFILGAIGVSVPYTVLTITFDYPDILRQDPGVILTQFRQGGNGLIATWWLFAILGFPLLIAYHNAGKLIAQLSPSLSWITSVGIIGLVVQMVGLLRWTFVVPVLANLYAAGDAVGKEVAKAIFQAVHQYGGVVLGEHLGQLFTIVWTVGVARALHKAALVPSWMTWLGYGASGIYLLAQAELFATVIPGFPVWDLAGFLGSTLWLVWLIALGVYFVRKFSKMGE